MQTELGEESDGRGLAEAPGGRALRAHSVGIGPAREAHPCAVEAREIGVAISEQRHVGPQTYVGEMSLPIGSLSFSNTILSVKKSLSGSRSRSHTWA